MFPSPARQMCRIGGFMTMTGKRERVKEFGTAEGKKEGVGKGDQKLSWRGGRMAGERVH